MRATTGTIGKMSRTALALSVLTAAMAGCAGEMDDTDTTEAHEELGLKGRNGLIGLNGLVSANGLTSVNGLNSINGLNSANGLNSINGLAANFGLMTSALGRVTISYLVECALAQGRTLTKKDQYGASFGFTGLFGLAPEWESNSCGASCQEALSACIMAHVNSAGVHVPLWFDAPMSTIGFGRSSEYPNQEGSFFGNLFVVGSDGKVPAYYCEGPGFSKGIVPGRLGASENPVFRNPFGDGGRCDQKCTAASGHTGDGYASCNGYSRPITVWRQASYRPDFDTSYRYKLINTASGKALEIRGWNTDEGGTVDQWSWNGGNNQLFQFVNVASSTWKIVSVSSGKVLASTDGSSVKQNKYVDNDAYEWAIDDHNGHFKITNKASKKAIEVPNGTRSDGTNIATATYDGDSNQDWDIVAIGVQ